MSLFTGVNLSLAIILSLTLIGILIQANDDFAQSGDNEIDWWNKDRFETLEEMLVRENIATNNLREEDFQLVNDYFNDNLIKLKRNKAEKSKRLAKELEAFNMIRYISDPSKEPCDMHTLMFSYEQAGDRPLVGKMIKHFGAQKLKQCQAENDRKFQSLQRSLSNPTVIEKLPADELMKLIPDDSPNVPKASWPTLIGLLYTANEDTPQSSQLLKQQCSYFDDQLKNYQYGKRLASVIKSISPEIFSKSMEIQPIEALYQRERLCLDLKFK